MSPENTPTRIVIEVSPLATTELAVSMSAEFLDDETLQSFHEEIVQGIVVPSMMDAAALISSQLELAQ